MNNHLKKVYELDDFIKNRGYQETNRIIIHDQEIFSESNIEESIKKIIFLLNNNPDMNITINNLEKGKKHNYKVLTRIKDRFEKEPELLKYGNNIIIGTPGDIHKVKLGRPFGYDIGDTLFSIGYGVSSLKDIYEGDAVIKGISDDIVSKYSGNMERIMAAYIFVSKFKKYKEHPQANFQESRNLYRILNNEYIVCEGYVRMFNHILDNMGIKNDLILYSIPKGTHAISLVEIDGIPYLCDPTFDNKEYNKNKGENNDLYSSIRYFAMTPAQFYYSHKVNPDKLEIFRTGEEKTPFETDTLAVGDFYRNRGKMPPSISDELIYEAYGRVTAKKFDPKSMDKEEFIDKLEESADIASYEREEALKKR